MPAILLSLLANPAVQGLLASAVLGVAGLLLRKFILDKAKASAALKSAVIAAAAVVDVIAPLTSTTVDDRIAAFLDELKKQLEAQGQDPSAVDVDKAKQLFLQMSGAK